MTPPLTTTLDLCFYCGHPPHGADTVTPPSFDVRCGVITGSSGGPMPEPEYCEHADWREVVKAVVAAQPAPPTEALRLLRKVLDEFDFWVSKPRPAIDGGTVRIHNFQEVQPNMERTLAEARRYLAATEEGTP